MSLESLRSRVAVGSLALLMGCAASATGSTADGGMSDSADVASTADVDTGNDVLPDAASRDLGPLPDVSLRSELHLLLSGSAARPGSTVTAVAYLSNQGAAVTNSEIRLSVDGGDVGIGGIGMDGAYQRANHTDNSLIMDKVCYGNQGDTAGRYPNVLYPSVPGNTFATVEIVPNTVPCPVGMIDTGLRTSKLYISNPMRGTSFKSVRASALSETSQPGNTAALNVGEALGTDLAEVQTVLSSEIVAAGGDTLLIVMARDSNGFGLGCIATTPELSAANATSTNREPVASSTNGCTTARNSYDLLISDSISINTSHVAPQTRGYLTVFPGTATSLQVYARGQGLTDSDDEWSFNALGNGAYILPLRATSMGDRGSVQIWHGNTTSADRPQSAPFVQVQILPR